jgi:hypothetical protein
LPPGLSIRPRTRLNEIVEPRALRTC